MKLYFLRHGLAEEKAAWKGDDASRSLTQEGIVKMRRTGETLALLELQVDEILTSPLLRARQTAEIAAKSLGLEVTEDKRLAPGFDLDGLRALLREHSKASAIMLVRHEPDFSATIGALIGGARVVCKKGGLALVELTDGKSMRGELLWLLPPRALAR